jgi:hypothetical protein
MFNFLVAQNLNRVETDTVEFEYEEDLDKSLLNQLCGEIMDEVMDLGECSDDELTTPSSKPCKKKFRKKGKKPNSMKK